MEKRYICPHLGSDNVSTSAVQMVAGRANFNQTIELPLNLYYDPVAQLFQDKKVCEILFRLFLALQWSPLKEISKQVLCVYNFHKY